MKKILFMLFAVLLSAMTVVSCSKDDSDKIENAIDDEIVGTWKLTDVKTSETGSYSTWPYAETYASFKSDGTYYGSGWFGTGKGTWTKKGKIISTFVDGQLYFTYEVISISSSYAELKMSIEDTTLWIKCKK